MINDKYWIALQSIFGAGNPRAIELALKFNDIKDLFSASKDDIIKLKCVTPVELNKLCQFNFDDAKSIIEKCSKNNYKIITYEDEEYPKLDSISFVLRGYSIKDKEIITNTITRQQKARKWHVGAQAGYGYGITAKKPDIFIGIGVSYTLW